MKFHINFMPPKNNFEIHHSHTLFLIGSCFSENFNKLFSSLRFKTHSNPNGIIFNPTSICNNLSQILNNTLIDEKFILERDTSFYSYLHHSSFSNSDKNKLIETIYIKTYEAHQFLKTTNYLFITFGTAFEYYHHDLNETVANCHKQAQSTFTKKLITVEELVKLFTTFIKNLEKVNNTVKIIFTVSPVKHLRDGLIENTISKSTLILGIHQLIQQHSNCFYFPAYELVNDDLRDYRFYKEDLAHPNDQAINYVWEKFSESFFSKKTIAINQEISKVNSAKNHLNNSHTKLSLEDFKLNDFIEKQTKIIDELLK